MVVTVHAFISTDKFLEMIRSAFFVLFGLFSLDPVQSFTCYEGFNATVLGIPLYHWKTKACDDCFIQEVTLPFLQTDFKVSIRYGGCVPPAYISSIACEKLFGENSALKPATILRMLPDLAAKFENLELDFRKRATHSFRTLFSNGTNALRSFIDGCFSLLRNFGLDTTKAELLKPTLQNLLDVSLPKDRIWNRLWGWKDDYDQAAVDKAFEDFLASLQAVSDQYAPDYPNSELPGIVNRIAYDVNVSYHLKKTRNCEERSRYTSLFGSRLINHTAVDLCLLEYRRTEANATSFLIESAVDLQYAINDIFQLEYMEIYQALQKAFPDFSTYIRFLQVFDQRDMKEFVKDGYKLSMMAFRKPVTLRSVVEVYESTIEKMASKFRMFIEELKQHFAPRTCKFLACSHKLCNSHENLTSVEEVETRMIERDTKVGRSILGATNKPDSTTSYSTTVHEGICLRSLATFYVVLIFMQTHV